MDIFLKIWIQLSQPASLSVFWENLSNKSEFLVENKPRKREDKSGLFSSNSENLFNNPWI